MDFAILVEKENKCVKKIDPVFERPFLTLHELLLCGYLGMLLQQWQHYISQ